MVPLKISANLAGWRVFEKRKSDRQFQPASLSVFERDGYACCYCGFQATEYQEVVNLDGDYTNNKKSNLATACCFCTQCLFLQSVGLNDQGGGQIIYLPEMTQGELNAMCHVLFCALSSNGNYQENAQNIYRALRFRSGPVETVMGVSLTNPAMLGQILVQLQHQSYSGIEDIQIEQLIDGLRLLPSYVKFKVQLDAWSQSAVKEIEEETRDDDESESNEMTEDDENIQ